MGRTCRVQNKPQHSYTWTTWLANSLQSGLEGSTVSCANHISSIFLWTCSANCHVPHTSILKYCAFCSHGVDICVCYVPRSSRSQWPRALSRGYAASHLLGMLVWIPPGEWIFISCESCVLSGTGLCVGLITCPEDSYRVWCVWVWSWSPVREGHGLESAVSDTENKDIMARSNDYLAERKNWIVCQIQQQVFTVWW